MPAGPAVIITPWNAPFMLATWKVAPALAAGNPVVLKPAEWSPLSASVLADLAHEAGLPPGVLNVVQGRGAEAGAALVADERVRRISFTGSPETARSIGAAAAANIVPFTAELGGKGPLIVFEDADVEAAARTAAGQYDDSGQVCLAGTRLLVAEGDGQRVPGSLRRAHRAPTCWATAATRRPRSPPSSIPTTWQSVEGFVERARRPAATTVLRGGRRSRPGGLWYEPTLIRPASNDSEIVQREVFGPVLTLQTFANETEAVELANSTRYGLSGVVFTGSAGAGRAGRTGGARRDGVGELLPGARPHRARSEVAASAASAARAATTPWTSTAT